MHLPPDIDQLAEKVITTFTRQQKRICTAESCTGGLIASALTAISGSSKVFERGFVAYSNVAKTELLGVMPDALERFGAISEEVAEEMAQGALDFSQSDIAVSVTGIAGPSGGTDAKPVGLVCFGMATREGTRFHLRCQFNGDRTAIRQAATIEALKLLLSLQGD